MAELYKDNWAGGDPDDVSGYLMDYLNSEFTEDGKPFDDGVLHDLMKSDPQWVEEVFYNIRNAVRAMNEDL